MANKVIGKVAATEKVPTTVDDFCFWTSQKEILNPFDVIKVEHIQDSITYGVIEEISHITDAPSYLTAFISNDFGDVNTESYTERIGMNYIKAKVIRNTKNIYIPVINGAAVSFATKEEAETALGLDKVENPIVGGYLQLYDNAEEKESLLAKLDSAKQAAAEAEKKIQKAESSTQNQENTAITSVVSHIKKAYQKNTSAVDIVDPLPADDKKPHIKKRAGLIKKENKLVNSILKVIKEMLPEDMANALILKIEEQLSE